MKVAETIRHERDNMEFILKINDQKAFISYKIRDGKYYLTYSEVPEEYRGQGYGKQLVRKTYEYLEENDIVAVPECSFVESVVESENL